MLSLLDSLLPDIPINPVTRLGIDDFQVSFTMAVVLLLAAVAQVIRGRSWGFLTLGAGLMLGVGLNQRSPFFGLNATANMVFSLVLLGVVGFTFLVLYAALRKIGYRLVYAGLMRALMAFGIGLTISLGLASSLNAFPSSRVTLAWFLNLSWWVDLGLAIWVIVAAAIAYAGKRLRPGWDGEPPHYDYS